MNIRESKKMIYVVDGNQEQMFHLSTFAYEIMSNSGYLTLKGDRNYTKTFSVDDVMVNGVQATKDNLRDLISEIIPDDTGGGSGGVTMDEVKEFLAENYVPWTKNTKVVDGETINQRNIILDNASELAGKDREGTGHNLAMLSYWDVPDYGSGSEDNPLNLTSNGRPTVQLRGETGEESHEIAFLNDISEQSGRVYAYLLPSLPNAATFNLNTRFRFRVQKSNPGFNVLLALWDGESDEEIIYWSDGVNLNTLNVTSGGSIVISEKTNNTIAYDFVITARDYTWNIHVGLLQGLTAMTCLIVEHKTIEIDLLGLEKADVSISDDGFDIN